MLMVLPFRAVGIRDAKVARSSTSQTGVSGVQPKPDAENFDNSNTKARWFGVVSIVIKSLVRKPLPIGARREAGIASKDSTKRPWVVVADLKCDAVGGFVISFKHLLRLFDPQGLYIFERPIAGRGFETADE